MASKYLVRFAANPDMPLYLAPGEGSNLTADRDQAYRLPDRSSAIAAADALVMSAVVGSRYIAAALVRIIPLAPVKVSTPEGDRLVDADPIPWEHWLAAERRSIIAANTPAGLAATIGADAERDLRTPRRTSKRPPRDVRIRKAIAAAAPKPATAEPAEPAS